MDKLLLLRTFENKKGHFHGAVTHDSSLFEFLAEWDPWFFTDPSADYATYKVFKKLNRVIWLEDLYDHGNTEIIVLNSVLTAIFGKRVLHYSELSSSLTVFFNEEPCSIGNLKSVFAKWHDPNTFVNKC